MNEYIYLSTRYRYKNLSISNSIQYMYYDHRSKETYRKDFLSADNSILTKSNEHPGMQYVYDKLSLAYDINKRHNIGVSFSAMLNRADYTNKSNTILRTNGVDVVSNYLATGANDADLYQSSLIYNWDIDDDGSNFSFAADYIKNNTFTDNFNVTTYENKTDSVVRQRYDIDTPWDLFKSTADLSLKLSSNSSLDAGGNFYYKNTLQKTNYENEKDNGWVYNDNLSDIFGYKGLGFALYAGYTLSLDKFSFSPNLRLQYDFIETHPYKQGINKRDYWHLFPELSASYSLSDVVRLNAAFGAGTYDIILSNLKSILSSGFNVLIRCNYTYKNIDSFAQLIDDIQAIGKNYEDQLSFSFQKVWQEKESEELNDKLRVLYEKIEKNSNNINISSVSYRCYADKENNIVINYNGDIYKCTGRDFLPELREGVLQEDGNIKFNERFYDRMDTKYGWDSCKDCLILPICNICSQVKLESIQENVCLRGNPTDEKKRLIIVDRIKSLNVRKIKSV